MSTNRDVMIAQMIKRGYTYRQIANELNISTTIVQARVAHIKQETGLIDKDEAVAAIIRRSNADPIEPKPTPHQLNCLRMAMAGLTSKEISKEVSRESHTKPQAVKNCFSALFRLIGASDRCHAATIAIAKGWITQEEVVLLARKYYNADRTRRTQEAPNGLRSSK